MKAFSQKNIAQLLVLVLLTVAFFSIKPPTAQAVGPTYEAGLNKEFSPIAIPMGSTSKLTVRVFNPNAFELTLSSSPAAWQDTLPADVYFASPANVETDCGGTVTTIGTTLKLIGGTVPAQSAGGTPGECYVSVDVTSIEPGNHINSIPANSLNASDPGGTVFPTNPTAANATLTVEPVNSPGLCKSFAPNTIWAGETAKLSIRVTNSDSDETLTGISFSDILPSGLEIANPPLPTSWQTGCGSPTVEGGGGGALAAGDTTVVVSDATIAPSDSCTVTVNVTSTTPGSYSNVIPANTVQSDQGVTNPNACNSPLNVQAVSIEKAFSPSNIQQGGTSNMKITLFNASGSDYTNATLTDYLPSGLTINSAPTSPQCGGTITYGSDYITLTGGTIPAGSIITPGTCEINAVVKSNINTAYTNTIPIGDLTTTEGATNVLPATADLTVYGPGKGVIGRKRFSPTAIALGSTSTLNIYITAPADTDLTNFSLSDALPAGLYVANPPGDIKTSNCSGGSWDPQAGDTLLQYTGGTIGAGKECNLRVNVTSDTAGTFTNTISPANITNTENRTLSSTITRDLTVSGLEVEKSFFPEVINPDGISRLTITLRNIGPEHLEDVAFVDTLPGNPTSGLLIAPTPNLTTTCPDAVVTADAGTQTIEMTDGIIPAQIGSVPGVCTVEVDVIGKGNDITFTNDINTGDVTATVHGSTEVVSSPARARATLQLSLIQIDVSKGFSPVTVFGDSTSTLTIRLSNPGESTLTGITFTDMLPQRPPDGGMSIANPPQFNVGTCGGSISGAPGDTQFTFSGGTLDAGDSCEITMQITMDVENNLINTIAAGGVTTNEGASNEDPADATLTNLPGASVTKYFVDNPIDFTPPSSTATVAIEIQNTSNILMTGMSLTDTMPTGMLISGTPVEDQCGGTVSVNAGADTITLADGTLDGLTTCTIEFEVEVAAAGEYENCIPAGTLVDNQDATNKVDTCDTLVVEAEVFPPQIEKSFNPASIPAGDTSVLTFTLTNPATNAVALTGVSFTDTFPTGLVRYGAPNTSQCNGTVTSTSDSITLTGGSIPLNGSCQVQVTVTAANGGLYDNSSDPVTSSNGGTGNQANDSLQAINPPFITKLFSPDTITAGGTSILTFSITNPNSDQELTGVSFTDDLPLGVEVAATPSASTLDCDESSTPVFNPTAGASSITLSSASIAAGDTCFLYVDVTAPNAGTFSNTTDEVQSDNGGEGNTATDELTVNGPGLSLTKSTTTASYQAENDIISYSYLLRNTGDVTLYQPFTVSDDKATVSCPATPASIAPGETITCTASYNVSLADVSARLVTNTATAQAYTDVPTPVVSNPSSVTVRLAVLNLQKTSSTTGYLAAGDTIKYDYTLTNTGEVTLYPPFEVTDDHIGTPPGTAFTCGSVASLSKGASLTCSATYTVQEPSDVTNGKVTNIANATAQDSGGETVTSTPVDQTVTVYYVYPPEISKAFSPALIAAGSTSTLTFTITNPATNAIPLTGVGFIDNLPSGMTVVTAPTASQCAGTVSLENSDTRVVFKDGDIIPGASCTVEVLVTVGSVGVYDNTSNVVTSTNAGDGNTASASLEALSPPAIHKAFAPNSVIVGESSTLTFTITNTNPTTPITGVSFVDNLPGNVEVADTPNVVVDPACGFSSTPSFSPGDGDTVLNFSNGSLDGAAVCTLSVDVIGTAAGEYDNTSEQIHSTEGGTGAASNTATLEVVNPAITLEKSIASGDNYTTAGDVIAYEYLLTNSGNVTIIGTGTAGLFEVTDDKVTVTCPATPAGLAVGATVTCTASYTVLQDDVDKKSVTNTAETSAIYDDDTVDSLPDSATANYGGTHDPKITLTKSGTVDMTVTGRSDMIDIGDVINYTFEVLNSGNVTLTDITVVDTIGGVTVSGTPIASLAPGESDDTSYTGSYTITAADLNAMSFSNTATATGTPPEGVDVSDDGEAKTDLGESPLIGIAKRVASGPTQVDIGTFDVTYEMLVKNYGNVTLHDVQVSDDLTATFPAPSSFSVVSVTSADFTVNAGFNGDSDTNLLDGSDTLDSGASGVITLVFRLVPATGGPFNNTATASGLSPADTLTEDASHDGTDPDPDDNKDPGDNDDPTPILFDYNLFDPPFGVKVLDATGLPELLWTMVWINDSNIVPLSAQASDEIPAGTTFSDTGISSGYPLPPGAPAGSTNTGVTCETPSAITSTTYCYYEAPDGSPDPEYPRGRIVWVGSIGPDYGARNADQADHEIYISFRVIPDAGVGSGSNYATLDADLNGDGDFDDLEESIAAAASLSWGGDGGPGKLPPSGFPIGQVTHLPPQPAESQYRADNDLRLVVPKLSLDAAIVSVPVTDDTWDVTWLGNEAGYLLGSAFPTRPGNTVITAHVWDANNHPGPLAEIHQLMYGDRIEIHSWGSVYTYEIRQVRSVKETNLGFVFQHEELDWLTLFTCEGYDPASGQYDGRRVVRAVLISVEAEQ